MNKRLLKNIRDKVRLLLPQFDISMKSEMVFSSEGIAGRLVVRIHRGPVEEFLSGIQHQILTCTPSYDDLWHLSQPRMLFQTDEANLVLSIIVGVIQEESVGACPDPFQVIIQTEGYRL